MIYKLNLAMLCGVDIEILSQKITVTGELFHIYITLAVI